MKNLIKRSGLNLTIFSSLAFAFACFGDTFLYAALPVNTKDFGVSVAWIGFLLSVNRLIRIATNHFFVGLFNKYGFRRLTMLASITSVVTTACYGLNMGLGFLIAARVLWGLSFAVLRISSINYSMQSSKQGFSLGMGKAMQESGPLFALAAGPLLMRYTNVQDTFLALSLFSVGSVFFAYKLPELSRPENVVKEKFNWVPSSFNLIVFLISFAADGTLVVIISKLLSSKYPSLMELTLICSFLLAYRRFSSLLFAPVAGWLADRWGIQKMFIYSILIFIIGLLFIILSYTYVGLIIAFTMNSINGALTPGTAVSTTNKSPLSLVASAATARDVGAALGALLGGWLMAYRLIDSYYSLTFLLILLLSMVLYYSKSSKIKFVSLFNGNTGNI